MTHWNLGWFYANLHQLHFPLLNLSEDHKDGDSGCKMYVCRMSFYDHAGKSDAVASPSRSTGSPVSTLSCKQAEHLTWTVLILSSSLCALAFTSWTGSAR